MCSHYEAVRDPRRYISSFGVTPPEEAIRHDLWPGYIGSFLRNRGRPEPDGELLREALPGVFGLLPHWAKDMTLARHTYNARTETVAEKPSFRHAWSKAQHCIIPADAFFEPDWRSGKAVPTRIARRDGQPIGLAGLWSLWTNPSTGELVNSFTMLTINAAGHELMRNFHKPGDEKRMVVILPENSYQAWLEAPAKDSMDFMRPYPADLMVATSP